MAALGIGLVVFALVRAPLTTPLALSAFAGVWWLRRERRVRIARFHRGRLRREIITSGLIVAALWVAVALFRLAVDMGRAPVDEPVAIEQPVDPGNWPGEFMIDGLLGTLGATYLLLVLGQSNRRRRRRRRPGESRQLAPLTIERDSPS